MILKIRNQTRVVFFLFFGVWAFVIFCLNGTVSSTTCIMIHIIVKFTNQYQVSDWQEYQVVLWFWQSSGHQGDHNWFFKSDQLLSKRYPIQKTEYAAVPPGIMTLIYTVAYIYNYLECFTMLLSYHIEHTSYY